MKKWVRSGLLWGGVLYIITMVLFPLIDGEKYKTLKLLLGVPLWIIVGLTMGYLFQKKKKRR